MRSEQKKVYPRLRPGRCRVSSAGKVEAGRGQGAGETILIDPEPRFDISPYLYMQFMEPLGVTDSSVDAAWDWEADDWRKDLVEVTRDQPRM